jgi:hypothetical protein
MTNLLIIWAGPIVSSFGENRLEEDFVWGLCWQAGDVAGPNDIDGWIDRRCDSWKNSHSDCHQFIFL